ncbi:MAG TPA: OsmC family peroxiredoxin [Ktedonobacterales bacterium]|nr:OsmC family peroxiredoxin [Ktedonobacterales bacterium]
MALAERRADATWQGNLTEGQGIINSGSGALSQLAVTWASRTERSDGKTSPEELIAAAHAACYAMAFSNTLSRAGTPPQQLHVNAVCTLDRTDTGVKIGSVTLDVTGTVPGLDEAGFEAAARQAEQSCPVSNALRNNVAITVNAHLG